MENVMEAELAAGKRRRMESGDTDGPDYLAQLDADIVPSLKLRIEPKNGKTPWWREEAWLRSQHESGERAEQMGEALGPVS